MNYLVIFMHPNEKSFNGAILDRYVNTLKQDGHQVVVRNLSSMNFNPVLSQDEFEGFFKGYYEKDIQQEHEYIHWAEVITFIYPLWWSGFPALGKGYIDRVFSFGFAYRLKEEEPIPLLTGKKALTICTMGTPNQIAQKTGMVDSINHCIDQGIFSFCGLEVIDHLYFGNVVLATEHEHQFMLNQVEELAKRKK